MTFDSPTSQLPLWSASDASSDWTVRESRRARRLTVRVYRTGRVEVIVPQRTPPRAVVQFLNRHRSWIERKREQAQRNVPPPQPFPPPSIQLDACNEVWSIGLSGKAGAMRKALLQWLMLKAQDVFTPLLAATAQELNCSYKKLVIRRQRTRWGSCSTRGTISLNCALLFQRPAVVRYLLIHELAHTQHMNHSPRFWRYVARHCPDYQLLDRELLDGWRRVPAWVLES